MIRRHKTVALSGSLVTGLALILAAGGCSDSPPPNSPAPGATAPQAETPELTAAEKKARQREFDNMGVKEKREWRRKQREAAGGAPQ